VIRSRRNIKAVYSALILAFSVLMGTAQAFAEDPNIGKSPEIIDLNDNVVSSFFQIWSKGAGPLNYSLSIDGNDAEYFLIDGTIGDVNGQSVDANDIRTHIVNINIDYDPRLDITLNARIVITENNDTNLVSYITLIAQFHADTHEPGSPLIGRSPGRIELAGNVTTKRFRIWNNETETMNYTLTLYGDDSDYFSLDTEQGQSEGQSDKQTHTVSVEYDSDFHNNTLYAWIEITDENDNTAYIDLSATETVATRVSYISIEQGINYSDGDTVNDFLMYIKTDDTVDEIDFTTPEGENFFISDYNENDDGSIRYWTYPEEPDEEVDIVDYGDGTYVITVTYDNNDTAQTEINFGIPNKPGTIVQPTQEPVITYPEEETVSPVRLEWEKCVDPNAGSVRLNLETSVDDEIINSIEKKYSKGTTKSSSINLDVGQWLASLSFGKWYQSENDDGIPYEVGKCARSYSDFEIMKWFGTYDDLGIKNHPLKLTDCNGTEVTFNLTGGGWGEIADEDCTFETINLYDTTEKSVFSIKTVDGNIITIGSITADGDIKAINGRKVDIENSITIGGGARSIILNNVTGSIGIGSYDGDFDSSRINSCVLKFNEASDLVLESDTPIRMLQATGWLSGSVEAPWISSLTIKGDFGADLTLSGGNPKGMTLKSAKIAGVLGGEWSIDGNCGTIQIAKSNNPSVQISGDIKSLKVTGNRKAGLSSVLSGVWRFDTAGTIKADSLSNCDLQALFSGEGNTPSIKNLTIKNWITDSYIGSDGYGYIGTISAGAIENSNIFLLGTLSKIENKGIRGEVYCFINNHITADSHTGTAIISYPKYNNGSVDFGLKTSSIDKLILKDSSMKTTWLDPNLSTDPIIIDDFKITLP
jgi:hypothetical protein